jgi:peptide/nickel transport system permease protein
MRAMICRRIALLPLLLLAVSFVVFALTSVSPTDPAAVILGPGATPGSVQALRQQLGLNQSLLQQYGNWLGQLFHGSLGRSWYGGVPVVTKIAEGLPITAALVLPALVLTALVALPCGLYAGLRAGGRFDRLTSAVAGAGLSLPEFWVGLILILVLSQKLHVLPGSGPLTITANVPSDAEHLVLPVVALALPQICSLYRLTRASAISVAQQDYIRTARAGGLSERALLWTRLAKNALVPSVTLLGLQLGRLIGVAAVIEPVFGMQGIGSIAVQGALDSDIPTVLGVVLVTAGIVMVANLLADVACHYLAPKASPS